MTQEEFTLFTNQTINFSDENWEVLLGIAEGRLASFLCLGALPDPMPEDFKMLLANFMAAVLETRGKGEGRVSSKHVRNFTISFHDSGATTAFGRVAENYGDLIEKYSNCGSSLKVERNARLYDYGCF